MGKTNKHYTNEEDRVIIDCVKRNPQNLTEAFKKAERILEDRTFVSVMNRWYYHLAKKPDTKCFITIGVKSKNMNRKIVTKYTSDNTVTTSESIWQKILKFLK